MEAALTWSFSFILNFVIILMVGWWIDTFVMFGNRMLQRCSLAHFWLWRSLFNWDRQLDEEHKDKGPGEFWYHISWHWIKHLGRHRTQNDCANYICCPQRTSYILSTNIAKGTSDPRVKCSHPSKDTRNCPEKVMKISHLKSNQSAHSIYIKIELCYFSLDQWEIRIHLLWAKCFNIPHHCDPHLNQTKCNDLLALTIPGVLAFKIHIQCLSKFSFVILSKLKPQKLNLKVLTKIQL